MSMTGRTQQILAEALADQAAASEVVTLIAGATGGTGTNPSVTTLTTSGAITSGGDVKIASGHTLKVNNISVVSAQQTAMTSVAVTVTTGALPTITLNAITISASATPTVVELLAFCTALKANIDSLQAILHAHGLTT